MSESNLPVVAIVGRPNVGKSALFNKIVGRRISIVHEQAGVTRDRVAAPAHYDGQHFLLVDTGGLGVGAREIRGVDLFDGLIREQVVEIVADSDALIWVVDCLEGMTTQDQEVAEFLRQSGKPLIIAANKADNMPLRDGANGQFAALGVQHICPTSCTHNYGVGELMQSVLPCIETVHQNPMDRDGGLKIAVVGRPNVGKSSLVNRIFGQDRVMVSDIAGTTRDAVDVPITLRDGEEEIPATFIDTAGLRRKRQVDTAVEFFSATRAQSAIQRADVILLVSDAEQIGSSQDRRIARMINDAGKPCIILVNKWDLVSGEISQTDLAAEIRYRMPFMKHAPIHFICALSGYNFDGIIEHLLTLREQMEIMVPTGVLNQFLQDTLTRNPPTMVGNRRLKIFYGTMTGNPPPVFRLFVNSRDACPDNYLQFLENRLRDAFFPEAGLPIRIHLRQRQSIDETTSGTRRAAAGESRRKRAANRGNSNHQERRKGWRKKK